MICIRQVPLIVRVASGGLSTPAGASSLRDVVLEQTLSSLWTALSKAPGEAAEVNTLCAFFHPEARDGSIDPR